MSSNLQAGKAPIISVGSANLNIRHLYILYKAWKGKRPEVSHLKICGSIAYALVMFENHHKLDEKFEKYIFIGYYLQSKAYRLYNPISDKVVISKNVIFDDNISWKWNHKPKKSQIQVSNEELVDLTSPSIVASTSTSLTNLSPPISSSSSCSTSSKSSNESSS